MSCCKLMKNCIVRAVRLDLEHNTTTEGAAMSSNTDDGIVLQLKQRSLLVSITATRQMMDVLEIGAILGNLEDRSVCGGAVCHAIQETVFSFNQVTTWKCTNSVKCIELLKSGAVLVDTVHGTITCLRTVRCG